MTPAELHLAGLAMLCNLLAGLIAGIAIGMVLATAITPAKAEPKPVMIARIA
jgi:hypothetical protein